MTGLLESKPVNQCISMLMTYHADLIAVSMEDGSYFIYKNKLTKHRGGDIEPALFKGILAQANEPIVLHHIYISKDADGNIQFN